MAWESSVYRKAKKKKPAGRKNSITKSEEQEYSNVTDAMSVSAVMPSLAEKHPEKLLALGTEENLNESPLSPEIDPEIEGGGNKVVKVDPADNWPLFPY